jgi:hypothetical protein
VEEGEGEEMNYYGFLDGRYPLPRTTPPISKTEDDQARIEYDSLGYYISLDDGKSWDGPFNIREETISQLIDDLRYGSQFHSFWR